MKLTDDSLDMVINTKAFLQFEQNRVIPLDEIIDFLIQLGFKEFVSKTPELNEPGMGHAEARH